MGCGDSTRKSVFLGNRTFIMIINIKKALLVVSKYLINGRPMIKIGFAFTDSNQKPVYYFEDLFGSIWMAYNKWSIHRVLSTSQNKEQIKRISIKAEQNN